MPAYEISNHARPGGESRHNLIYWRYGEYVGVGPGAHGRIIAAEGRAPRPGHRAASGNVADRGGEPKARAWSRTRRCPPRRRATSSLLMGLRLSEGIDPARFQALTGKRFEVSRVADLIANGMVEYTREGRIRVTSEGFPVLDAVVADLAA